MTGEQARLLKTGDFVRWRDEQSPGLVQTVQQFMVEIKWSDGSVTQHYFNEMGMMVLTDSNGAPLQRAPI